MIDDSLTLPGDIPGLLRRGSPVVAYSTQRDIVTVVDGNDFDLRYGWVAAWNLELDLTDATGRAHAAWWLAAKLFPGDGPYVSAAVIPGRTIGPLVFGLATESAQEGDRWRTDSAFDACGNIDPLDPYLLPDGSRWVDAEALRRAVLHVAGRSS